MVERMMAVVQQMPDSPAKTAQLNTLSERITKLLGHMFEQDASTSAASSSAAAAAAVVEQDVLPKRGRFNKGAEQEQFVPVLPQQGKAKAKVVPPVLPKPPAPAVPKPSAPAVQKVGN